MWHHLSATERKEIVHFKRKGYSLREIARLLGRSVSTISEEQQRNKVKNRYHAKKAEHKAYVRRRYAKYQGMKIVKNPKLRKQVEAWLVDDQSPEAIAGRLRKHERLPYVSKNSVYRFIASPYGRRIEYLREKRKLNRKRRKRPKTTTLANRRSIEKRPQVANLRQRVGDVEGDFVESGKDGRGKLLVIVDRKLRVTFICQLRKLTVKNLLRALKRIKKRFPEWKTLTIDNDIMFRDHKRFEKALSVKIYFCHPYSSWEKGTVENTNKYIRREIPKGSNINSYSPQFVRSVERKLNRRMMKCLSYLTPQEVLDAHRVRKQKRTQSSARKRSIKS